MIMKKTILILCAFLALTASSCEKQNTASQEQAAAKGEYVLSFTADSYRRGLCATEGTDDETLFMKKGAAYGATVKNGLEMLLLQAFDSWEFWTKE